MSVIVYHPKLNGDAILHEELQLAGKKWPAQTCETRAMEYWHDGDAEKDAVGVVIPDSHEAIEAEYKVLGIEVAKVNSAKAVEKRALPPKSEVIKKPDFIDGNLVKSILKQKIDAIRKIIQSVPLPVMQALEVGEEKGKNRKFALKVIRERIAKLEG